MSLRGQPLTADATLPDGRAVSIRIGVPEDSYIPKKELDTVTIELHGDGEHLAAVNTTLGAAQVDEARRLLQQIVSGLEAGTLAPTAGDLDTLV